MASRIEVSELEAVRHDLKNVLMSLRHGCALIGSKTGAHEEDVHAFLDEMRSSIEQGFSLVERLRRLDQSRAEPTAPRSGGRER